VKPARRFEESEARLAASSLDLRNASRLRPATRPRDLRTRLPGIAFAVGLHVAAIVWLLQFESVRRELVLAAPIMVNLISPPQVAVAPPKPPEPVKPKPQLRPRPQPQAVEPPPIITAPTETPSTFVAPAAPAPQPPSPIEAAPKAEAAPPPAPIVPPRYNADYLQNPAPTYPPLARRIGEQGRVILRVLVSSDGVPEKVELRTSSGSARLDESALDTVKRWKFVPARQGSQPVAAWVLVPIFFSLQG
jgi:protein TonB